MIPSQRGSRAHGRSSEEAVLVSDALLMRRRLLAHPDYPAGSSFGVWEEPQLALRTAR